MGDGTDEQVLDEFFQAVTPTIEDMVTRAVQQGQRLVGLAVVVERKFDGEVTGGSCARSEVGCQFAPPCSHPICRVMQPEGRVERPV